MMEAGLTNFNECLGGNMEVGGGRPAYMSRASTIGFVTVNVD